MEKPVEQYSRKWWLDEVTTAERRLKDRWWESADKVVERYLDERGLGENELYRYNIFWANVGILRASLYATPPKPMVSRQYGDYADDTARVAGEMLERLLTLDLQKELSDTDQAFRYAVEDRLIPGAGVIWFRYEVTTEKQTTDPVIDPMSGAELAPAQEYEKITDEQVETDHVHFKDFIYPAARVWEEVPWVARRVWMTRDAVEKRFGKDVSKLLVEEGASGTDYEQKAFARHKTEVYEIWCRDTRKVYWISVSGSDKMLDEKDDILQLPGFFPCPRPLFATLTTNDLIPRPDYVMVQDQYRELDELSERIVLLEKALRVAGVFDSSNQAIQQLVNGARENTLIPVDQWAALSEKGGLRGVVDWMPIDVIAKVMGELKEQRVDKVQQIYELTGLSDIMRGATAPRETATAQSLKAQYSSVRLQYLQQEVGIFVQQGLRIKAEIICRHFQPETILERSNIQNTPDAPLAQAAVQLLKDTGLGKYRIEVNSDSMAIPDYNAERTSRIEFMTMLGQFLVQVTPILQSLPQAAPFFLQLIQWCAAGFRGSRQAEAILDQGIKALQNNPPGPVEEGNKAPPTDPMAVEVERAKGQTETIKAKGKVAGEQAKAGAKQQMDRSQQQTEIVKGMVAAMQPLPMQGRER